MNVTVGQRNIRIPRCNGILFCFINGDMVKIKIAVKSRNSTDTLRYRSAGCIVNFYIFQTGGSTAIPEIKGTPAFVRI